MNTLNRGLVDPELAAIAAEALALAEQDEVCHSLAAEMLEIQRAKHMPEGLCFDARRGRDQRPIFIVCCDNGWHESHEGYRGALELLVTSHRPRIEDLESTYKLHPHRSIKVARAECARIARTVRAAHPDLPAYEQDAIILAEIRKC